MRSCGEAKNIEVACTLYKQISSSSFQSRYNTIITFTFHCRQIWQHYLNVKPFFIKPDEQELEKRYRQFFAKQNEWTRQMIQKYGSSDAYWRHVSYIVSQFDGLYAGYKATAETAWVTDGNKLHYRIMKAALQKYVNYNIVGNVCYCILLLLHVLLICCK